MKPQYFAGIFVALLLFAGIGCASTYEVNDYDPERVGQDINFEMDIELENTGSEAARDVRISLTSSDPGILVTDGRKTLAEIGEGEEIELSFSIQVGKPSEGDYDLTLTIRDRESTVVKTLELDIEEGAGAGSDDDDDDDEVNEEKGCSNDFKLLGANLVNEEDRELNPTDKAEIVIYLKSLSTYELNEIVATIEEDEWRIRADGKWSYYDFLKEGNSRPGYFVVETDNAEPGTYELELDVEYEKRGKDCSQKLDFNLTVKGEYGVLVDMKPDSTVLEQDTKVTLTANVRNTGNREDSYTLTFFEGVSDWVHEAPKEIVLERGKEKEVPITLYIPEVAGSYQLGIKAISNSLSSVIDTDVSYLNVEEAEEPVHRIEVDYPKETFDVSPGETKTVVLLVENLGNSEENVHVSLGGPYWAFVAPARFSLGAGESRKVSLYFAPDANEEMGTQDIVVRVSSDGSPASSEGRFGVFVTGGVSEGGEVDGSGDGSGEGSDGSDATGMAAAAAGTSVSLGLGRLGGSSMLFILPIAAVLLVVIVYSFRKYEKEEAVV